MIDLCRVQGQLLGFRLGFRVQGVDTVLIFRLGFRVQGLDTVLQGQLLIFSA